MLNLDKQKLEDKNEELISLNQALENQTNQLQEFAYISSHNLRSPAGNIRALLDFYHNDPNEENFKIVLEKLDVVSEDLLDTINDLAGVVKIKNEVSQDITKLSLSKLIAKTEHSLSQQINDTLAVIEIDLNGIEHIQASKTYMESIILNLTSNALKYSQKEVAPRIYISAAQDETCLILKVEDNGLGIDMELYGSKLFGLRKTFHKNKDSRGVGLFITKAQVEAMQGTIYADSEPGKGTTFYIRLPKKMIV
jgi:signal transduction histidine kinase